jgi:ferrous iron transport protein B
VERKIGQVTTEGELAVQLVDVPGTYSLNPRSMDEEIAYRVLVGEMQGQERPDLIVCVVDAGNLERNLYLTSQVLDLGIPTIIALNMTDSSEREGVFVDASALSRELGVPVFPLAASSGRGIDTLRRSLAGELPEVPPRRWKAPPALQKEVDHLADCLAVDLPSLSPSVRFADALRALANTTAPRFESHHSERFWNEVEASRQSLRAQGTLYEQEEIIARYQWITPLAARVIQLRQQEDYRSVSERIDSILTHRFLGPAFFLAVLLVVFQAVFSWAAPFMNWIQDGMGWLSTVASAHLPAGLLRGLIVDGVLSGVGGVLVFLPQILLLFFFLGLLEDTGYMARVAFIMDRPMRKVGLSGRSVVPLISSYACAIPGIMATRTMDSQRDRLVTMMVAPFMTCSARLPVYALVISAFVPAAGHFGFISYQALALMSLYLMGTGMAVLAAAFLRHRIIKGTSSTFVMELPPYHRPRLRDVAWRMSERAKIFLTRAGTIILAMSIVLWFLAAFPQAPTDPAGGQIDSGTQLANSYMGRAGHLWEPMLKPLGFDWKIGVALLSSFAAREVVVSALGTIYSVGDTSGDVSTLEKRLVNDTYPDGTHVWSPLVAASLLMFFVLACQCMSTLAVVKRETNSWRWPLFMWTYMFALAWIASFTVYQGGLLLGWG